MLIPRHHIASSRTRWNFCAVFTQALTETVIWENGILSPHLIKWLNPDSVITVTRSDNCDGSKRRMSFTNWTHFSDIYGQVRCIVKEDQWEIINEYKEQFINNCEEYEVQSLRLWQLPRETVYCRYKNLPWDYHVIQQVCGLRLPSQ